MYGLTSSVTFNQRSPGEVEHPPVVAVLEVVVGVGLVMQGEEGMGAYLLAPPA